MADWADEKAAEIFAACERHLAVREHSVSWLADYLRELRQEGYDEGCTQGFVRIRDTHL